MKEDSLSRGKEWERKSNLVEKGNESSNSNNHDNREDDDVCRN